MNINELCKKTHKAMNVNISEDELMKQLEDFLKEANEKAINNPIDDFIYSLCKALAVEILKKKHNI